MERQRRRRGCRPTRTQVGRVGTRFSTTTAGTVTAILFYKHAATPGCTSARCGDPRGRRLATVRFTGESASGWQIARLATPVALAAGSTYVVSYHATAGRYADDTGYFGSGRSRTSGPLTATAGVYAYGSTTALPTRTWRRSNYYVDVAFVPGAVAPKPSTTPSPTAGPTATATPTGAPSMSTSSRRRQPARPRPRRHPRPRRRALRPRASRRRAGASTGPVRAATRTRPTPASPPGPRCAPRPRSPRTRPGRSSTGLTSPARSTWWPRT